MIVHLVKATLLKLFKFYNNNIISKNNDLKTIKYIIF